MASEYEQIAALLLKQFDQAQRPESAVALACLGVRLKLDGWVRRLRSALPPIKDAEIREDALRSIAESRNPEGLRFLLSLFVDPKDPSSANWDIAQVIVETLPASETLAVLLSSGKSDADISDEFPISFIVSGLVEHVPHGLQLIRDGWKDLPSVSRRCAILMGLGELLTRQDVSMFLHEIAQSQEDATTRGTALISASRLAVDSQETFTLASRYAYFKASDADDQYTMRAHAISALSNMYRDGSFAANVRDVFHNILEQEPNPWLIAQVIETASQRNIIELRDVIQRQALETTDARVREAASKYLKD